MDFGLRETFNAYVHAQIVLDISKTHFYHQFLEEKHAKSKNKKSRTTSNRYWIAILLLVTLFVYHCYLRNQLMKMLNWLVEFIPKIQ
jgi:hypothetical protein